MKTTKLNYHFNIFSRGDYEQLGGVVGVVEVREDKGVILLRAVR